jgi:hypothetical protein
MNDFSHAIAYTHGRVSDAQIQGFGVPHLVVDDVLSPDMVERINAEWPVSDRFSTEVTGNFIYQMYRRDYGKMSNKEREFWVPFNEQFWPALVASCAHKFSPLLKAVFGEIPEHHFTLDWPLTLAQAGPAYEGINVHNHFWHAPHWAFTVLLYIDPYDVGSSGTALHRFGQHPGESSYSLQGVETLVDIAMDPLQWQKLGQVSPTKIISYRQNRIFVMMDGPLAIHSVRAGPISKQNAVANARRRILRCHAKVDHNPFYEEHAHKLGTPFGPAEYTRLMYWGEKFEGEDLRFRNSVLRQFYRERMATYATAWSDLSPSAERISADAFLRQTRERVP